MKRFVGVRTLVAIVGSTALAVACAGYADDEAGELRRAFPTASHLALDNGVAFERGASSLVAKAERGAARFGVEVGEGGLVRVRDDESGFDLTLREAGAFGPPERIEHAASFTRERGRAYWSAGVDGVEEWLAITAPAAGPVASWSVDGARLHPAKDAIDVLDAKGTERLRITAPAAYGEGERPLTARIVASGTTLELFVDGARPGEKLLVDPKYQAAWILAAYTQGPRVLHSMSTLPDGEVVIFNGYAGNAPVTQCEVYDPGSNRWRIPFAIAQKRAAPTVTTLADGRVLVAGGNDGSGFINGTAGVVLDSTEISDPLAGIAPVAAAGLQVARQLHTATLLPDGRVLVVGGASATTQLASFEVYDPKLDHWTLGNMDHPFLEHTETLLGDGRVLVVSDKAEIFDPATNAFTVAATPPTPRLQHTATLLENGKVLVAGGSVGGTSLAFASASLYDPRTNAWTNTGSMSSGRQEHTATRLADGRVLVAGGLPAVSGDAFATAEIYDPASGVWTAGPTLHNARFDHTAALLSSGQVIVVAGANLSVGGGIPNTADLSSVELYSPYLRSPGEPCDTSLACGSGFCVDGVCCNVACDDSACSVCSVSAGGSADGTCMKLDAQACKAHPCSSDAECDTHHCADGVCCDKKCDGKCETCAVVRGTCIETPTGLDPRGDCVVPGTSPILHCGPTCDGHGKCLDSVTGTTCVPSTCSDETHAVGSTSCALDADGGLACPAADAGVTDCAPFKCDGLTGACKESCTSVRDCPNDYVCTPRGTCERRPDDKAEDFTGCAIDKGAPPSREGTAPFIAIAVLGITAARRRRRDG